MEGRPLFRGGEAARRRKESLAMKIDDGRVFGFVFITCRGSTGLSCLAGEKRLLKSGVASISLCFISVLAPVDGPFRNRHRQILAVRALVTTMEGLSVYGYVSLAGCRSVPTVLSIGLADIMVRCRGSNTNGVIDGI